ncbi:MAG: type II secretion system F family protein [Ardenticatenia bacterium]|nr:type II secretion system F family protein [Ardenticatenia bacterium]
MVDNPLIISATFSLAIFLIFVGLTSWLNAPRQQTDERLQRYAQRSGGEFTFLPEDYQGTDDAGPLPDWLNKRLEERAKRSGLLVELARADLKLTPGEWMAFTVLCVILSALIGWLIFRVLLLAILAGMVGLLVPRFYLRWRQQRRIDAFNRNLASAIGQLANALRAGYSLLQAMDNLAREMPPPISTEFERVVREMSLGLSMEEALNNMLERVPSDDLDMMVTAINIQAEVGGNLAEILDILAYTIRERVRIQGEIKVLTAQQMMAGYVLTALPILLGLALFAMNREYMEVMYTTTCGWIMLSAAGFLIVSGFLAIRKIVQIEV